MCGIAGFLGAVTDIKKEELKNSFRVSLYNRGPDGDGEFHENEIFFYHARLSIIDLNTGGQPLYYFEENQKKPRLALIANGEIYNYKELKQNELSEYKFNTNSDCEVILYLYLKYNLDFLKYLRGMYAFALYDHKTKQVILSRDTFGIKPLYYTQNEEYFAFASTINTLLDANLTEKEIEKNKIIEFLQVRYNLTKQTIFKNISRVLPGETLVIEQNKIKERFLFNSLDINKPPSISNKAELTAKLEDTIKVHLRSDVPVGLFFSGGIDSSAILHLMKKYQKQETHLFIAGFPTSKQHDETEKAVSIATNLGCIIHKVEFSENDFWHYLDIATRQFSDPVIDPAALPSFKLAEEAGKHVKVVLCGEGGDEFCSGYRRHYKAGLFGGILKKRHTLKGQFRDRSIFKNYFNDWKENISATYDKLTDYPWSNLQKMQAVDSLYWLPYDLLTKLDICTMSASIEGRTPFVDQILSPYFFHFRDRDKVKIKCAKWFLRKWLQNSFPASKPFAKKHGFKLPIAGYLRARQDYLLNYLPNHKALSEIFHSDKIKEIIENFEDSNAIYSLLYFSLWHDQHIGNNV